MVLSVSFVAVPYSGQRHFRGCRTAPRPLPRVSMHISILVSVAHVAIASPIALPKTVATTAVAGAVAPAYCRRAVLAVNVRFHSSSPSRTSRWARSSRYPTHLEVGATAFRIQHRKNGPAGAFSSATLVTPLEGTRKADRPGAPLPHPVKKATKGSQVDGAIGRAKVLDGPPSRTTY